VRRCVQGGFFFSKKKGLGSGLKVLYGGYWLAVWVVAAR
jgi:hypothetical protein